ncbi:MAG: RagB/SusD family nutrient uptake outer membrane protein [Bacteroidales bacterium]
MKNLKYILFSLLAFAMTACNNDAFFELQRPPQFPWNSVSELEFAAVAPYNKFFYTGWSAPQSNHILNQVIQSDYFRFVGNVEGYATDQVYKRKYSDRVADVEGLYTSMYGVIGLCNNGLEFYRTTNNDPFPYASDADSVNNVNRIKGELLFMRAYAYYHLAVTFCPPYGHGANNDTKILVKRDHISYSSEDALNNAPATTGAIYDMMVADLKEAKSLLPTDWVDGMHLSYKNRGRANKWAASAVLAQVYFTMGKFTGTESALTELDDVIGNGGYSLTTDPFECFNNSSTALLSSETSSKEVIFWNFCADIKMFPTIHNSFRFTHFNKAFRDAKLGGNGNTSAGTSPKWSFTGWWQMCMAKNALVEMGWMNSDGSETNTALWDKRYNNPTSTAGYVNEKGLFYRFEGCYKDTIEFNAAKLATKQLGRRTAASDDGKYIISAKYAPLIGKTEPVVLVNKYYRTADGKMQNTPVIRLAELYLNRAMIKKRANIAGWAADYNKVAARAWNATLAGTAYVNKTDAEVSERMILVERWKELAGEDVWYIPFCEALGYEIGQGDRTSADNTASIKPPYSSDYWKNCIPLSELDFQPK